VIAFLYADSYDEPGASPLSDTTTVPVLRIGTILLTLPVLKIVSTENVIVVVLGFETEAALS
jgi:hypothetical protein